MGRHAYLIMAHRDFRTLERLLQLVDDPRNDVYIHVDTKAVSSDPERIVRQAQRSRVHAFADHSVYWGGFSQIACELSLLRKSLPGGYEYYHLLSGQDLPIKSQDYIHDFFDRHNGLEFIHYGGLGFDYHPGPRLRNHAGSPAAARARGPVAAMESVRQNPQLARRLTVFHLLQEYRRRSKYPAANALVTHVDRGLTAIQMALGINRWPADATICYGPQWVSITHALGEYLIDLAPFIRQRFRWTSCGDEFFIQTLAYDSERFRRRLYAPDDVDVSANLRLIDWSRGSPYVWRAGDFEELMTSPCLFARKFDSEVDREIVERVCERLTPGRRRVMA
jgi:hypothetical protein